MRILFFTNSSSFYGASQSLFALVMGLKEYGIESIVITPSTGPLNDILRKNDVISYQIPITRWVYKTQKANKFFWNINNVIKSNYLLAKNNYKQIQSLKSIINKHQVNLIYSNTPLFSIGFFISRILRLPHVWHLRCFGNLDFGYRWNFGFTLTKKIINTSDLVIANSNAVKKHYSTKNKSDINVVYNGVISKTDYLEIKKGKRSYDRKDYSTFNFAIIGSINEAKGQKLGIKAFSLLLQDLPNCKLFIIGKGNIEPLEELCKSLGIADKVVFTGHVNNVEDYYSQIDVILVTSQNEAFGRVTAEAMAVGKPVIGRNSGGTVELLDDGISGLLFSGNHEDLATKMKLLINSPELLVKIKRNAFIEAGKKFTTDQYVESIYSLIDNLTLRA